MSVSNKRARKVRPPHPGEMLREDFLPDYGLTVSGFAKALKVSRQTVNELLHERRAVSPEMALPCCGRGLYLDFSGGGVGRAAERGRSLFGPVEDELGDPLRRLQRSGPEPLARRRPDRDLRDRGRLSHRFADDARDQPLFLRAARTGLERLHGSEPRRVRSRA